MRDSIAVKHGKSYVLEQYWEKMLFEINKMADVNEDKKAKRIITLIKKVP